MEPAENTHLIIHRGEITAPPPAAPLMEVGLNLEQYLELLLGPREASSFDSEESRCAAWHAHAAELLPLVDPGSRPWAWWEYDAPEPLLPRESAVEYLRRCALLTESERFRLELAGI